MVVLDGGWNRVGQAEDVYAPRWLYYVAMTRAKQPLTLARLPGTNPFLNALGDVPAVLRRQSWCLPGLCTKIRYVAEPAHFVLWLAY